jgi:phosphoenolpyruvate phosphomutase / 2-hydroxyethylphosphonate cytidylyltransferase
VKAVILNSGVGSRMGELTVDKPKCLVEFNDGETILSRQLQQLIEHDIDDILITIGPYGDIIPNYVEERFPGIDIEWVRNEKYDTTNYIYSMYLADKHLRDDILLLHGDLVFDSKVLKDVNDSTNQNLVVIDSTMALPEKDFKCLLNDGYIREISIDISEQDNAYFLLPMYKLSKHFMNKWMDEIQVFIAEDNTKVYAENAFNRISESVKLVGYDKKGAFCMEVDTEADFIVAKSKINE